MFCPFLYAEATEIHFQTKALVFIRRDAVEKTRIALKLIFFGFSSHTLILLAARCCAA